MQQLFFLQYFFIISILFGCTEITGPYYYRVILPENLTFYEIANNLENHIKHAFPEKIGPESYCVEISIIRYSLGKEIYSLSTSSDDIVVSHGNIILETMVRIKKNGNTRKIFFIKTEADNKEKLLRAFIIKIAEQLNLK